MSFDSRLKGKALLPSTRKKYREIIKSAGREDLVKWMRRRVHARTPIGTILPMRAAVSHYLVSELGYTEDQVKLLLPKAKGRSAEIRHALTPQQLAEYHAAVEYVVDQEPARTILMLLPMTGLRISEMCSLRRENVRMHDGRLILVFRGKGDKQRILPLSRTAESHLQDYMNEHDPDDYLFVTLNFGRPISPHGVRKYTRKLASLYPDLAGLCPHVLRHTFATMALRSGVDLARLQAMMGHESIETTRRYLHPSVSDLQDAIDKM